MPRYVAYLGMILKGTDPRLPFAISALTLLVAVVVLQRVTGTQAPEPRADEPQPIAFPAYLPLLLVLALASGGFQLHAFVNSAPRATADAPKGNLPWLMPLLWLGFFAALVGVAMLIKRFGALAVAAGGDRFDGTEQLCGSGSQ